MKKILIAFALCTAIAGHAQNAKKDASGNYVAIVHTDTSGTTPAGKTYTDSKGNVYPVMVTKNGKLFVIKTSKTTGKPYKQYLKVE